MKINPQIDFIRIYTKYPDNVAKFYLLLGFRVEKSKPLADFICFTERIDILIKKISANDLLNETSGFSLDISFGSPDDLNQVLESLKINNYIVDKKTNPFTGDCYICYDGSGNYAILSN